MTPRELRGFGSLRTRAANFAGNGLDLTEQDLYSVAHWSILPDGWWSR